VLKVWASERGLLREEDDLETIRLDYFEGEEDPKHRQDQSQLFLLLYIEKLVSSLPWL
jgi:hypothetical protein